MARVERSARELVEDVLAALKRAGTVKHRDGHARYGIVAPKAFGVKMGEIQKLAKSYGKNHELAGKLWASGWYEARMMAAYVEEAERVTPAQMDRWCAGFADWSVCDTVCFAVFDRTPHAFAKIEQWHTRPEELVKRAAFALLASVALHDKRDIDDELVRCLPFCATAASDQRNFVKKGVSWALRTVGVRNAALHAKVIALATRLAASVDSPPRWIGKDVLRDLERPLVAKKLAKISARQTSSRPAPRTAAAPRSRRAAR
ncbi:MAG: DNA alkylation repair protein [Deltaproteobacteria bacterium]|nr:DNA alkylation repair protein [Deltaproteobacteria bacterium]